MRLPNCSCACVLLVSLLSCQKNEQATSEPAKPVEVQPVTEEVVARSDIPVPEDFEEAAYAQINEDNLDEQVDALESEITSDGE